MVIFSVFMLLGGLAFFLYGMNVMSSSLEKMAGGKLEEILKKFTTNPFKSLLFGAGVTVAIQSSSAMTVMLVGFVNSGIMELYQTIGIIMGSNIGTTLTAWISSLAGIDGGGNVWINFFKPENFSPVIALIGIFLIMVSKSRKKKDVGSILMGFSILMFGMTLMSDAVSPLADIPQFKSILVAFKNPILGVLVGALFTGVIQSSAASIGILQALSISGSITFGMAIPIVMGQNIGTCVTALLSSIGVNKNAKRVAVVHIYFNLIGTVICLSAFYALQAVIGFGFVNNTIGPVAIAGLHSVFNLVTTSILFPFTKQLERLAIKTIPDNKQAHNEYSFLDERLLATPSVAIATCYESMLNMSEIVRASVKESIQIFNNFNEEGLESVKNKEQELDDYEDRLGTYLLKLTGVSLSDVDVKKISEMLHLIGDFERIGDHALNIAQAAEELHVKKIKFSDKAVKEILNLFDAIEEILDQSLKCFIENDVSLAVKVEPLEEVIDIICDELKEKHIQRLCKGECSVKQGFVFSDLLTNCERISDHCSNVAVCIIKLEESSMDIHKYVQDIKSKETGQYKTDYQYFYKKYIEVMGQSML